MEGEWRKSRGLRELAGVGRFGEAVEICGKEALPPGNMNILEAVYGSRPKMCSIALERPCFSSSKLAFFRGMPRISWAAPG